MLPRAGAHTGWFENADRNRTPRPAMASRLGVKFMGLRPMAPTQSQRNWSDMIRTILGRFTLPPVCADAAEEADMAAETPASHSLRVDPGDGSDWTAIMAVSLLSPGRYYDQSDYIFAARLSICSP